jgi:hypothetical protein
MGPRPPRTRTPMLVPATTIITRRDTNSRNLVNTLKHLTPIQLLTLALSDAALLLPQPACAKARRHARTPTFATRLHASVHA